MVESSTDFLFGEDLKTVILLTESDSCDESPETALMVEETPFEMQTEETETHLPIEWSKTFKSSKGLQPIKTHQKRSSRILL